MAAIELAWALSARRAARAARGRARAVLYSSSTAALLAPRPGRDPLRRAGGRQPPGPPRALAAAGRAAALPRGGAARAVERGRAGRGAARRTRTRSSCRCRSSRAGAAAERDIAAITYGAHPEKKGLDRVLAAWAAARREGEELVVAGLDEARGARVRGEAQRPRAGGARRSRACGSRGRCRATEYRALLRRARVFVTAPRREDHGIAQLEALADGCALVTTPSPGPYAALPIARDARPAARHRRPRDRAAHRARRPRAGLRGARGRGAARRTRPRRSTAWWPTGCSPVC